MIAAVGAATQLRAGSAENWALLELIVDEALDAPADAREALVRARCGPDLVMRDAALVWLRACDEGAQLLDVPVDAASIQAALHDGALCDSALDRQGTSVGPWRLLREIGRGGMGVVYLAERTGDDVDMRVALKFMRHADALDAVGMRRFHDERRILAALAHPAIARLVDVGMDDGVPWLAMEYVAGAPIDAWCDARALSVEARITLFCSVVDAVQHAHARLVVHRDLKPANILVSDDGDPKLLDFGIAKLLDASGMHADQRTRTGLQPMTPAYASPEQKRGGSPSTTGDVYALGVLLHVLLTGELPSEGVVPSAAVRRGSAPAAANRGTTTARLARRLSGVSTRSSRARSMASPHDAMRPPTRWPRTCAVTSRGSRCSRGATPLRIAFGGSSREIPWRAARQRFPPSWSSHSRSPPLRSRGGSGIRHKCFASRPKRCAANATRRTR